MGHALEPVRSPLLKLRANHSPNPGLRKSLIFRGTAAWKSKKSEKSKMYNRLAFEFAVKVRKSTIRELHASRRDRGAPLDALVQRIAAREKELKAIANRLLSASSASIEGQLRKLRQFVEKGISDLRSQVEPRHGSGESGAKIKRPGA